MIQLEITKLNTVDIIMRIKDDGNKRTNKEEITNDNMVTGTIFNNTSLIKRAIGSPILSLSTESRTYNTMQYTTK